MTRFTQNDQEIMHLIKIQKDMPITGVLQITLNNGVVLEGVSRGASAGNNFEGGMLRPTAFKADIKIQSIDGTIYTVDLLDVQSILDIWQHRKQAYIDAGIVTVLGW